MDSIVVSDECLTLELESNQSIIDDPHAFADEDEEEPYFNYDPDYELHDNENESESVDDSTDQSAILMRYAAGALDQFPTLSAETTCHPWAIPPRSANRQFKPKSNSVRVRARRRHASDYPAWEWTRRFDDEPKFDNQRQTRVDEARAELRRQLDEGPTGPPDSRRVRARRWHVPGRPPD